ncbi:DUF456 domain-containing protein [Deinococcus ruber]|uniref:DUF456 domain-containing protein n=1 Tax=Deinococcus ruber TaxID=1848197 RepID=A0A918C0D8_9DEIO|nr:DUF456 family protein [Deinococcus ruber]GGR01186.1 hypothetical protein GCM10008957_12660 [Deinococcus ruber]
MTPAFVVFLLFWVVGVVGTFIPVVPATLIILLGTFVATFISGFHWWPDLPILLTFTLITIAISLVDNLASAWGARRYGGSRQAGWGALAGGLVGIFIPFGLLVGPLAGALLVELIWMRRSFPDALRAAWGTLLGLLAGIAAKFVLHILVGVVELWRLWEPAKAALS